MMIKRRKVRNGASCNIMFKAIAQMSILQQQSEQQVTDLEIKKIS